MIWEDCNMWRSLSVSVWDQRLDIRLFVRSAQRIFAFIQLKCLSLLQVHCTESSKFPAFSFCTTALDRWQQLEWWRWWWWSSQRGKHCVDLGRVWDLVAETTVSSPLSSPSCFRFFWVPQSYPLFPSSLWLIYIVLTIPESQWAVM